ncbi:uncharacterized protein LOC115440258 isoform X1 [Manduca sexta]|uniref:uncharacterized protein LOC115440258 isoform X1 n=1 Tax=Manduca sexta TaxID=7130 RepID=UPI00188EF92B|nr:uncharacterized protein LOC115440258 isoform X1 [Manduca sexta]
MRRLTEDLPNHNVEVQLEIVGSISQAPAVDPQRRYLGYFNQPSARRYNTGFARTPPKPITTTDTTVDTTTTTHLSTTSKITTTTDTTTTDAGKRPVYMDDLKQALQEFEKKFTTTESTTSTDTNANNLNNIIAFTRRPFHFSGPSAALKYPIDRSLQGLVKLLRNGLELESPVARPTNENLEWFQVKIPKTA